MQSPKFISLDVNKNPYESGSPEWQLWENMKSNETLANTFMREAEEAVKRASAAREKSERFRAALTKLSGDSFETVKLENADVQITVKDDKSPSKSKA